MARRDRPGGPKALLSMWTAAGHVPIRGERNAMPVSPSNVLKPFCPTQSGKTGRRGALSGVPGKVRKGAVGLDEAGGAGGAVEVGEQSDEGVA